MPRKPIDHSNTHFYKIICKDTDITDFYIGHTTDFTKRKSQHKHLCHAENDKRYNIYVYEFIRENGGWDNWDMVEIEKRCCKDSLEAKSIERDLLEKLNAMLNRKKPVRRQEEDAEEIKLLQNKSSAKYRQNHKEQIQDYLRQYHNEHKEGYKDRQKQWKEEKRERVREYWRSYRERNRDEINRKRRERRQQQKEQN